MNINSSKVAHSLKLNHKYLQEEIQQQNEEESTKSKRTLDNQVKHSDKQDSIQSQVNIINQTQEKEEEQLVISSDSKKSKLLYQNTEIADVDSAEDNQIYDGAQVLIQEQREIQNLYQQDNSQRINQEDLQQDQQQELLIEKNERIELPFILNQSQENGQIQNDQNEYSDKEEIQNKNEEKNDEEADIEQQNDYFPINDEQKELVLQVEQTFQEIQNEMTELEQQQINQQEPELYTEEEKKFLNELDEGILEEQQKLDTGFENEEDECGLLSQLSKHEDDLVRKSVNRNGTFQLEAFDNYESPERDSIISAEDRNEYGKQDSQFNSEDEEITGIKNNNSQIVYTSRIKGKRFQQTEVSYNDAQSIDNSINNQSQRSFIKSTTSNRQSQRDFDMSNKLVLTKTRSNKRLLGPSQNNISPRKLPMDPLKKQNTSITMTKRKGSYQNLIERKGSDVNISQHMPKRKASDISDYSLTDPFSRDIKYLATENDIIDKMLETFVKNNRVRVPIIRLENSRYLFGTKVFNVQIINGMLMVRVGGGYQSIEEFIYTHSPQEISRLKYKMAHEKKKLPKVMSELVEKNKLKKFT